MSPDGKFVEMVEYANHPWFLACQFHPEYKSKPLDPHPLFRDFIAAAYEYQRNRLTLGRSDSPDAYAAS
jgi:CTP synthase